MAVLPFVVAGAVLVCDSVARRLGERRRIATGPPPRAAPLLLAAAIGVLSHPALDWLNTYGIRLLSPISDRWFYGDALFIVDPWLWLMLGGGVVLSFGPGRSALVAWVLVAALASAPVLLLPFVPPLAKAVWLIGLAILGTLRVRVRALPDGRAAAAALVAAAGYIGAMVTASMAAEARVRRALEAGGHHVEAIMFQPHPANPFAGSFVVHQAGVYRLGEFGWLSEPRVRVAVRAIELRLDGAAFDSAAALPTVRDFLTWARFPNVAVRDSADMAIVFVGDARYADEGGVLSGVTVRVRRHPSRAGDTR
jgi:inner membrane protein